MSIVRAGTPIEKIPFGTRMGLFVHQLQDRFPEAELDVRASPDYHSGLLQFRLEDKSCIIEMTDRGKFDIYHYTASLGDMDVEKEGLQGVLNKLEKAYGLRKKQIPEESLLLAVDLLKARYPCIEISIDADDQKRYGFIDIVYGNEEKKRLLVECLSKGGYVVTLNFEDNGTPHCTFESVLRQLDKVMTTAIVTPRIETGPIRFGEDWPGTFIRGDDSAFLSGQLKMALDLLKRVDFTKLDLGVTKLDDVIMRSALEGLLNTLFSSNIQKCQDTCLKLKPADECVVYKVPGDLT